MLYFGVKVDDGPRPAGKRLRNAVENDVKIAHRPVALACRFGDRIDHVPHRVERHIIKRALLIELGENFDRLAQVRVLAGVLAEPRHSFGEWHFAGLLGPQMLLDERIEVLVSLLQRTAVILAAKQALDAVGAEPLPQAFRHGLGYAFKHFADAEAL